MKNMVMLSIEEYQELINKIKKLEEKSFKIIDENKYSEMEWDYIRTINYYSKEDLEKYFIDQIKIFHENLKYLENKRKENKLLQYNKEKIDNLTFFDRLRFLFFNKINLELINNKDK